VIVSLALAALLAAAQGSPSFPAPPEQQPAKAPRAIAIDDRLAADAGLSLGDRVLLRREPGSPADSAIVAAITLRGADPSEIARGEYRVRLHLDQLQRLLDVGDRVDRFAVETHDRAAADSAIAAINAVAFGFRAHRSDDIAVETSRTFQVVRRFHRAIGVISVVASAIFLLCLMLLRVDQRRREVAALRLMGISRRTVVRSIVIEAAAIALLGSIAGVALGAISSAIVNAHYRGVYRTSMTFALVTPGIAAFALALSIALGVGAGYLAARRLVGRDPLTLMGR
jgi:putative ABC transport system permease protein